MAAPTSSSVSVSRRGSTGGDLERAVLRLRGAHDIATKVSVAVAIPAVATVEVERGGP